MPKSSDLNDFDFSGSESSTGQRSAAFPIHGLGDGISQSCGTVPTSGSSVGGGGPNGSSAVVGGGVGLACGEAGLTNGGGTGSGGSATGSGRNSANGHIAGGGAAGGGSHSKKYRHQNFSKNIYIGTKNAEKWDVTRQRLAFKNDVEFVTYLLSLAENDNIRSSSQPPLTPTTKSFATIKLEPNLSAKDFGSSQSDNCGYLPRKKHLKRVQFEEALNGFIDKSNDFASFALKHSKKHNQHHEAQQDQSISSSLDEENIPEVLDCRIAEKIKNELEGKSANGCGNMLDDTTSASYNKGAICLKKTTEFISSYDRSEEEDNDDDEADEGDEDDDDDDREAVDNLSSNNFRIRDRSKKKHDIRKAPTNGKVIDNNSSHENKNGLERSSDNEEDFEKEDNMSENSRSNFESRLNQSCRECTFSHDYEKCPFRNARDHIPDCIEYQTWKEGTMNQKHEGSKHSIDHENDDDESTRSSNASNIQSRPPTAQQLSFSESSLPLQLEIRPLDTRTIGVFSKIDIPRLTRLGPVVGEVVQANDIPEECNMQYVFEIFDESRSQFISTENPNTSNWARYVRVAPSFENRTVNLVNIDQKAYFVSCVDLKSGSELLYWSDECNSMWQKKNTEKTNCGGCNIKFDHPIYYRTHCSVFHDPLFSLTIRKYHCKVCGEAVLGKDNIMKHAAQKHDGKGAYQCQFCKKFFLRLNYLEMHRTYGCSANPQRARPLCDFCGRKFCQPQKLKVHIKRMHSDMAEVLRDFQCKLCAKLLGSRAALQRHCKEVHSRNSTVVSCPRCQKLFQNRSNLKIHMLTHSGVRPFKCAESECTAAFTTKQCLQFHYKKVHNYTQEQMPKIERSVAYTFDAYSGGMKVDFLEQAPRRRRKSMEDQNSILSSTMIDDSKSESDFSEDNIFETLKKSGKSIKDLCQNETNLSLLSSKASSVFSKEVPTKRRKKKFRASVPKDGMGEDDSHDDRFENARRKQNAQMNLVESFLTTTAQRLSAVGGSIDETQRLIGEHMELPHQHHQQHDDDNNFRHIANIKETSNHCQNLVVSKGSKKWISDDDRHMRDVSVEEATNKLIPSRDFLARFMMNNSDQSHIQHEEDENSTFLDVVDSNNPGQISQFHESQENQSQLHINPLTHPQSFISSFYNPGNARLAAGGAVSTSASMLVEAALNSVGSIIDNEGSGLKCPNSSTLDSDSNINAQMDGDNNRFGGGMSNIESIENELKIMKSLNNFPMQIPSLPMFQNAANSLNSCNLSPNNANTSNVSHNNSNNNEIDVDSASTPRGQPLSEHEKFSNHHHTPPSPQVISPGRDYTMFGSGDGGNGASNNNISSSPLPSMQSRRSYPEHELISPASSPSLPRYDFSNDMCRKRAEQQQDDRGNNNLSVQNQMSSDEENSIIAQNSTASGEEMRVKFNSSQMELMYSKYDGVANPVIKYNNQELDVSGFRSNTGSDISDMQGLDMTSRANVSTNYHHNFQLPTAAGANLGLGRYHHHIYDILSEREQQQQQHHQQQQQQQQQQDLSMQHQPLHNMMAEQLSDQDHDQATTVDLSRTANYSVASPPALSYPHPHHDMLRMVSLDLTPNTNMAVGNNRPFLSSQIAQHNSRETLDHHRLLSSAEQHRLLAASNPEQHRLLVDPAAHLLMEQNNRLLATDQGRLLGDSTQNRHMMSARSFGAYHQGNYHPTVRPVLSSTNHHTPNPSNYHPFPAYY